MPNQRLRIIIEGDSRQAQQAVRDMNRSLEGAKGQVSGFSKTLKGLAIAATAAFAIKKVIDFGSSIVEVGNRFEKFKTQLTAVYQDAAKGEQAFKWIRKFAERLPQTTDDIVSSFVQLRSVGIQANEQMMQRIADVSFAMNRNVRDVATGLVSMETEVLRRLGVMVDRTGDQAIITSGKMRKVVEKDFESMRDAVLEIWGTKFAGATKNAEKTWEGLMGLFKSTVIETKVAVSDALLPVLKALMPTIQNIAATMRAWVTENKQNIGQVLITVLSSLLTTLGFVGEGIGGLITLWAEFAYAATSAVRASMEGLADLLDAMAGLDEKFANIPLIGKDFAESAEQTRGWAEAIRNLGQGYEEEINKMYEGTLKVGETIGGLGDAIYGVGETIAGLKVIAEEANIIEAILPPEDVVTAKTDALKNLLAQLPTDIAEIFAEAEELTGSEVLASLLGLTPEIIEGWELDPEVFTLLFEKINANLEEQREALIQQASKILGISPDILADIDLAGIKGILSTIQGEVEKTAKSSGQAWSTGMSGVSGIFGDISSAVRTESGKQKGIVKAAAVAQNVISTYLAATKAYSSLAGIPIIGPVLGAIAAAAAVAAGVANLAKIRSAKRGGIVPLPAPGAYPGLARDEMPIIAHAGERIIPADEVRGEGETFNYNVNFSGPVLGEEDHVREVVVPMIQRQMARDMAIFER